MSDQTPPQLNEVAPVKSDGAAFPLLHFVLLLVVAACLFFAALGRFPLLEPDEGRNAEVAREMVMGGDWITPHFNNFSYLDKPPVYFWLVAASFKLGGLSELSARFPSALAALGTMLLLWFFARRLFQNRTALYAGIIFATSPLVIVFAREVIFDMTLTFFVTAAMVCFWIGESSETRATLFDLLFFAAMGVATLTKGPVGFLLPILSIFVYKALQARLGDLKKLHWRLGLVAFFVVVLPWFIAVSVRHPDFPGYALWRESLQRFAAGGVHRAGSVYYYIPIYLAGFLPWSFFLLYAGYNKFKHWKQLRQERLAPVLFLLSWAAVIFVFFSISHSKLPGYFLPAMVPLSILMAKAWTEGDSQQASPSPDWLTGGFATLIVLGIIIAFITRFESSMFLNGRLATKMPSSVLALLKPSLIYTGLILAALGFIGRNLCARARGKAPTPAMFVLLACTFPLLLLRWIHPLQLYISADSSRQLAATIQASPQKDLPVYGYYYFRTGLPFYLRRPVGLITSDGDEFTSNYIVSQVPEIRKKALARGPGEIVSPAGPFRGPLMVNQSEWLSARGSTPVLVLVRNGQVAQLAAAVHQMNPMWSGWKYSVLEIPPDAGETTAEPSPPAQVK